MNSVRQSNSGSVEAELLSALDEEQQAVARQVFGPVCVRAGAGTGKTRAITHRIAYAVRSGAVAAQNILAVTFTDRAAAEMRTRLRELGVPTVQARTFHSAALSQLRYFWPQAIGGYVPEIRENKSVLVAQAAAQLGMSSDPEAIRGFAGEVEWAKVSLLAPDAYAQAAQEQKRDSVAGHTFAEIARLLAVYEDVKSERGVIDFEDVLLVLVGIMSDRPEIAAQIRKQYNYFVVDEFQDVSALQYRLLQLWLGTSKNLCVVGDVSQTIFSFTGADARYLSNFSREFPQSTQIVLNRDYRSSPQIVDLANTVISHSNEDGAVYLKSMRPSGRPVLYNGYDDDTQEAEAIATAIKKLSAQGRAYSDCAILYRTNAQSAHFESALGQAGIPYTVRGAEKFFQRREVREVLAALRGQVSSSADLPVLEVVKETLRLRGWRPQAPQESDAFTKWQALQTILELAVALEPGATLRDFVGELLERAQTNNPPQTDAVTLCSLHAAKGLEWPVVFLAGMSEGLMPISRAKTESMVSEERRLLYVGITRAAQELHISYAKGTGKKPRECSRFLKDEWPSEVSAATRKRYEAKEARADFEREHSADLALFEELSAWRAEVAHSENRSAFTVVHDASLRIVAVMKPRTLEELGRVKGIGARKLMQYGPQILEVVARFQERSELGE